VYVQEAHPVKEGTDGDGSRRSPKEIAKAASLRQRAQAAVDCLRGMKLSLPVLLDTMDGQAWKAYRVRQAATAVIAPDGTVRFHASGPGGARPKEAEEAIQTILEELKAAGRLPPPETDGEMAGDRDGAARGGADAASEK
jgi:hypothetical protein